MKVEIRQHESIHWVHSLCVSLPQHEGYIAVAPHNNKEAVSISVFIFDVEHPEHAYEERDFGLQVPGLLPFSEAHRLTEYLKCLEGKIFASMEEAVNATGKQVTACLTDYQT